MRIVVFDQWERLVGKIRGTMSAIAEDKCSYAFSRLVPVAGRAALADRAANLLALSGGVTTLTMPESGPGKARDFALRVTASGENTLKFEGAEAFEGEPDALDPPGDGETCVYCFTETAAGVFLVARKTVERIETEGGT